MDVLSYAKADADQHQNQRPFEPFRFRLSRSQWKRLGETLNATVVPFSFWRSRYRKLLIGAGAWTIAVDEVGNPYSLRARTFYYFANGRFSFEIDTASLSPVATWIGASVAALRVMEKPALNLYFDAHCTVLTDAAVAIGTVLSNEHLQTQFLSHPPFRLFSTPQFNGLARLTMITRPGDDLPGSINAMCSLVHNLLLRLRDAGHATAEGVHWTRGVK